MPSLLDLPSELVDLICQWSDECSLLTLRLVCRDLAAKTLNQVKARFFTNVQILVTQDDLQWLRNVSQHPAFRYSVRKLWIRPCLFENRLLLSYYQWGLCRDRRGVERPHGTDWRPEQGYQAYKDAMGDYLELVTTEKLHDALRDCIASLPNLQHVHIYQTRLGDVMECYGDPPLGPTVPRRRAWGRLTNNIGINPLGDNSWRLPDFTGQPNTRAFVFMALLKVLAVVRSARVNDDEYSVDTLDLCSKQGSNCGITGPRPIALWGADWSAWGPAFQHFKCRHLYISLRSYPVDEPRPRISGSLPDTDSIFMRAFAETTPHLKTLSLQYKNMRPAGFISLSKSVRFRRLESLVLAGFYTTSDALIEFLRTAAPTLRQLRIQRVTLATIDRASPQRQEYLPPEEIRTAWFQVWDFIKASMKDLQLLYFNIPTVRGGLRVTNPLRGRVGDIDGDFHNPTNCYDAAVTDMGVAEWIDQLGFEDGGGDASDDSREFDSAESDPEGDDWGD
ncbi:hypothetical protein PG993_008295 [Apiospora rasikravindrae]|uniref:F-box domain-containing protein n=1 Tax=Apiospora rasikravindrae TaxID=990691 RepID=A0ABR1SZZ2_9PEZI